MGTNVLGLAIEGLVAVLLVTTIGYCWVLNSRLVRLRADEKALKATIVELINATEVADRAIAGLKEMAYECDKSLSMRLVAADRASNELAAQLRAGETVLNRIALITEAARRQQALAQEPVAREPTFAPPAHAPVAFAMPGPHETAMHPLYDQRNATARSTAAMAEALTQRARQRSRGEAA
jgi:hypothetical protein